MKIHIAHTFPCDVETYWRSVDDPELDAQIRAASKMDRELLSEETLDDGVVVLKQRFVGRDELPGPAAGLIGSKHLSYVQTTRIDRANNTIHWQIKSPVFTDKVKAGGTYVVRPHAEGCERVLDGEVSVKVAMFGKRIEKLIVDVLEKAYANGRLLRLRWLKEQPANGGWPPQG